MSVNLQMSQAMNVKMGGGGPSRMGNAGQMVSQQQPQQHPQHHHQPQQPTPQQQQQHPSMMRAQQQQSFAQQQQATMSTGNPYQRNMASGYGANPHQQQQYQQANTTMQQSVPVSNPTSMLNTNSGLPPRNTFSPSDFNFDFLDQPLANDSKNGFNNKQQTFSDFNFDFLDAH